MAMARKAKKKPIHLVPSAKQLVIDKLEEGASVTEISAAMGSAYNSKDIRAFLRRSGIELDKRKKMQDHAVALNVVQQRKRERG